MMKLLLCLLINFISMSNTVLATTTTRDVFKDGPYMVAKMNIPTSDTSNPPKPLIVSYPHTEKEVEVGVVMLLHGFLLNNAFYSQLMHHITSYGFIVVAPQLYSYERALILDSTKDIETAANITKWLASGILSEVLPHNLIANLTHRFALAGHSRGGKDAFGLALGTVNFSSSLPLSALIGIDPVDGIKIIGLPLHTPPAILSNNEGASFTALNRLPVMVIGSGLEDEGCTPKGLSHEDFYRECEEPACHFVVKGYGHLDVLNDKTTEFIDWLSRRTCRHAASREPMRRFVGGASVAFLKAYLDKDDTYLMAIKEKKNVTNIPEFNVSCSL